jgi:hypothetical protein
MVGDHIFDLGVENEALRGKLIKNGWVSLRTMKLCHSDARKNRLILERMKRQKAI